ncbi:MAG TPA: uracil-DNA glycosylase [Terriglobales bacterium]|nr:uracil-DNA glycosylase [Terriglobales bacterium]
MDLRTQQLLAARLQYYRELGIYDFYRRDVASDVPAPAVVQQPETVPISTCVATPEDLFVAPKPEAAAADPAEALRLIKEDLGECTRCVLARLGRKTIVFGEGDPNAELMFVGEGPGADEDEQGRPFVGRAGQLLNKMIEAMGLKREQVYIANVVKCRPPGNRTPEREEIETCSPFLLRQVTVIQPKAIVALGAVAARCLLGLNEPMARLRGRWFDFRGTRLAVTYHPAFLLRDPRQKKETWKDLQMVMEYLGLKPRRSAE